MLYATEHGYFVSGLAEMHIVVTLICSGAGGARSISKGILPVRSSELFGDTNYLLEYLGIARGQLHLYNSTPFQFIVSTESSSAPIVSRKSCQAGLAFNIMFLSCQLLCGS